MSRVRRVRSSFVILTAALAGCAFHRTATHWNGHVGTNGEPVFVQTSTYWGANFGIVLPMFGRTTIDAMVDAATARIRSADGSRLRVIETESNNYWWSVPPLTWLIAPMLTSVSIEFQPSAKALAEAAAADRAAGGHGAATAAPAR